MKFSLKHLPTAVDIGRSARHHRHEIAAFSPAFGEGHISFVRAIALAALVLSGLCARPALAQQTIGSTAEAHNRVLLEVAGAAGPLSAGDNVFRNEVVRTGPESAAKLVFLDSTNLAIGPISRVTLDEFVYSGGPNPEKVTVNLAKGVFRFTTGKLDKKAYEIKTSTSWIGVRGTVLDIDSRLSQSSVTLVEGRAIVCARRAGSTFEEELRACSGDAPPGAKCDCVDLNQAGQTALVKRTASGTIQTGLSSTPVNIGALCSGSLCTTVAYASLNPAGGPGGPGGAGGAGGVASLGGGFPAGALCGH